MLVVSLARVGLRPGHGRRESSTIPRGRRNPRSRGAPAACGPSSTVSRRRGNQQRWRSPTRSSATHLQAARSRKAGARDLVVNRFMDYYDRELGVVPSEVLQPAVPRRMNAAYPIHPEMFDRLYQDWSTLERFQRTRGVLRLMATVVHALWVRGDQSALIMPATIPLDDTRCSKRSPVTSTTRGSPSSMPTSRVTCSTAERDRPGHPLLGKSMAGKRVARVVFLGTAR